jgi:hypothetical protein
MSQAQFCKDCNLRALIGCAGGCGNARLTHCGGLQTDNGFPEQRLNKETAL